MSDPANDDDTTGRPKAARAARLLFVVAAALALLAALLVALLHAPPVARAVTRAAVARASAALGCSVEAGHVRWNLLAGRIELRDVALRGTGERAGTEIALRLGRADLSVRALLRGRVVVEEVVLDDPSARLAVDAGGTLLFPFPLPEEEEPETGRPDVEVRAFRLSGGRVELLDRGPAGRRAAFEDVAAEGRLSLRNLDSTGTLRVGGIDVSARGVEPLRGSTFSARWETRGGAGTATARLDARPAGLVLEGDARLRGRAERTEWDARLAARGDLGPLAARLAPDLGLGGAVDARAEARGAGTGPPAVTATARATAVTLLGRAFDRVDAAAELAGGLLRTGTFEIAAGKGRLRGETSGTLYPAPKDLRFAFRVEGLDLTRVAPARRGAPRLEGTLEGSVAGTLARPGLDALVASADLALRGSVAARGGALSPDARLRARVAGGVVTVETATLAERTTRAALSGTYDHARGTFAGRLEAETADVGPYLALFGVGGKGALSVRLEGGGPVARPALDGELRARGLAIGGARIDCVEVDARSDGGRFSATNGFVEAHDVTAGFSAEGAIPLGRAKAPAIDLRVRGARFRGEPLPDLDAQASLGPTLALRVRARDGSATADFAAPAAGGFRVEAALDRFDLAPFAPLVAGWVRGFGGTVTARLEASRTRTGAVEAALEVGEANVTLAGRHLSASFGAARVKGERFEVARLELRGDDGSYLVGRGGGKADGSLLDVDAKLEVPELAAWDGLLPPPAEGETPAPFDGRLEGDLRLQGSLERPTFTGAFRVRDLHAFGAALARLDVTLAPREDGRLSASASLTGLSRGAWALPSARLEAVVDGSAVTAEGEAFDGQLRVKATGSLAGARPFEAAATLAALDLAPFLRAGGGPADVAATTSGKVRLRGTAEGLRALSVEAELDTLEASHPKGSLRADGPVSVVVDRSRVEVRSLRLSGSGLELEAKGDLPLEGAGSGLLSLTSSLDLAVLLPFVDVLDRAQGRLTARLEVAGTAERPVATGSLAVEDALLDGPDFPTPVEKLTGTVTLRPGEIRSEGVSARIGGGTVVLAGGVGLSEGTPRRVDATLRARDLELEAGPDVQVRAAADLTAKGEWSSVHVAGEVRLEDVVYVPTVDLNGLLKSFRERKRRPAGAPKGATSPYLPGVSLDLAVLAKDAIHLEGNLGEAELGGTLRVRGTPEAPVVLGTISSTRGTISLFGSSFDLARCRLEFKDPLAIDPEVDVVATTTKEDEEITIRIDGTASKAQLFLSSTKGRSQAEIISVLLGGSGAGSGSELSAAAARMAMRSAATPILGALGARADLEIVPLPTTPEGEEFLFSVGKDLGGGISATYYKGVSGETTDALEMKWRISSRARGRLRQNQDGSLSGGFRIRRDLD